jgi:hypothetical protein
VKVVVVVGGIGGMALALSLHAAGIADVKHILDRRPLGEGQLAVLRAHYETDDDGLWIIELALPTGRTPRQVVGVLETLGDRTKRTPGFPTEHGRGIGLLIDWRGAGERWQYRLLPMTRSDRERRGLV